MIGEAGGWFIGKVAVDGAIEEAGAGVTGVDLGIGWACRSWVRTLIMEPKPMMPQVPCAGIGGER